MGVLLRRLTPAVVLLVAAVAACTAASGEVVGGVSRLPAAPAAPTCFVNPGVRGNKHTFSQLYRDFFGNTKGAACAGDGTCHGDDKQNGALASHFVCPRAPNDGGVGDDADVDANVGQDTDAGQDAAPAGDASDAATSTDADTNDAADDGGLEADDSGPAPIGPEEQACYATMTGDSGLVKPGDALNPQKSYLYTMLRKANGTGFMPLRPPCIFTDADMKRITDWIDAGAPND